MFTKTTNKDHKGSAGVLMDLIRKHGASSPEVQSYMERFKDDDDFIKKANMLVTMGKQVDAIKTLPKSEDTEEK